MRRRTTSWERPAPDLSLDDLARFYTPLTWPEIKAIEPRRRTMWWRLAILNADEYGLGLLRWVKRARAWTLTDRGRQIVEKNRSVH